MNLATVFHENHLVMCQSILAECTRVTDRQTDGQIDVCLPAIAVAHSEIAAHIVKSWKWSVRKTNI